MSFQNHSHQYQNPLYCMSREWPQNAEKDAKNGDVSAQLFMAYSMFNNDNTDGGSKMNAKKGCELLERAGEIFHDSDAIDLLGSRLYMTGQHKDIPQDLDKGMYWLLKGAQNGNGHNAFQLAMAYTCGLIPVNPDLEEKWLQVAVKLGYHEANGMLQMSSKKMSRKEAKKLVKKED